MEDALTIQEAADYTGITWKGIKSRVERGTLDSFLGEDNRRYILTEELDKITQRSLEDLPINPYEYDPKFSIPKAEIWGDGKAPLLKPSTHASWEKVVFVSDIHVPYHDPVVIDAALELIDDYNPDRVVINGDTNDFFQLSHFNKASERLELLQAEIDTGKAIRAELRRVAPNAIFEEIMGNHEERLVTYPGFNAPALRSLSALKPSTLLGLDELEIAYHPVNGFRLREEFLVEHGVVVRKDSGASAKARLDHTLISGIMGHTHRIDSYTRSGYRNLEWFEQGCLCLLNPDYVSGGANWRQGFAIGEFSTRTKNFNVDLIRVTGRGFIYNGRHYGNTQSDEDIWSAPIPQLKKLELVAA
jgi:predicted phosphodiesterase